MTKKTEYQKGEEIYVLRSQITEAPYNPRIMGEGQEKRLRAAIQKHGMIGTLFWNKRTGNLVAGHQRLKALDFLEGYPEKTQDYEIRVTAVNVSEKEEKQLNVILNNPSVQGEFDIEMLGQMIQGDGLAPEDMGFTESDMVYMFDGDPRFSQLFEDTPEVEATKDKIREVRDARSKSMKEMKEAQSAEFYCTVVFQDERTKKEFLRAAGIPVWEEYVNGAALARKFGVELGIEG
ncbi:MAG: ParB N-terminal domain-containing protein [Desulfovibrio sp.]|jgi:hypothetical protein|nr:ParB N-terminal domain-containing protein [Desulfovibrio sp.]